ncbi:hypothetical protein PHSC3_000090 [Chlamydiales bacterium STE3]|nr:hypothetical protein PHSC3_000090 [Chlamydiales bacterium STE3]
MLFLIAALSCEAEPLIDHFDLQEKDISGNFLIYESESIILIVSGVGKCNIATAVGYLYGLSSSPYHAWLNIGVASHATYSIGQGFAIHKITDISSHFNYYPVFTKNPPCPTASLVTIEKSEKHVSESELCDTEGSAFFVASRQFSTVELIHCYKVVSVHSELSVKKIDKKMASRLIGARLSDISQMADSLKNTAETLKKVNQFYGQELSLFFFHWHFSSVQSYQLKRLLQKWRSIEPHRQIWDSNLEHFTKPSSVLEYLEEKINSTPLVF